MLILQQTGGNVRLSVERELISSHLRAVLQKHICIGLPEGWFISEGEDEYFCWDQHQYVPWTEISGFGGGIKPEDGKECLILLKRILWIKMDALDHFLSPELVSLDPEMLFLRKSRSGVQRLSPVLLPNLNRNTCIDDPENIIRSLSENVTDPIWNRYKERLIGDLSKSEDIFEMQYQLERAEKDLYGITK